jgi:hypothetical protein
MCTVSWIHTQDGYQLLCNRDELDTRLRAEAPATLVENGVRYLAPTDGNFGGTWITVNEYGLTLALLNRSTRWSRSSHSRGHLVRDLAPHRSADDVQMHLEQMELSPFAGFDLVVLQLDHAACLFEWDTRQLVVTKNAEHRIPLTSSSFDAEGVARSRLTEFTARVNAAGVVNADVLLQFHQSHGLPGSSPSAYSTCMHRPGARTVSFTWVDVSKTQVQVFYSPASPCEWALGETVQVPRKVNSLVACG